MSEEHEGLALAEKWDLHFSKKVELEMEYQELLSESFILKNKEIKIPGYKVQKSSFAIDTKKAIIEAKTFGWNLDPISQIVPASVQVNTKKLKQLYSKNGKDYPSNPRSGSIKIDKGAK